MKFSNGCWLQKENCECFAPQEVYYATIEKTEVTLCTPTSHIVSRGDTLGGVNLTVKITSPMPEVLRVQTYHHMGCIKKSPEFELEITESIPLDVTETEETITIKSGTLSLAITKANWQMVYSRNGEVITKSGPKDLACMKTNWRGLAYEETSDKNTHLLQYFFISSICCCII